MPKSLTAQELFDTLRERLGLSWLAGQEGSARELRIGNAAVPVRVPSPVGFLNLVRTNQVQVLGSAELIHLREVSAALRQEMLGRLFSSEVVAVIAHGADADLDMLRETASAHAIPLFKSTLSGEQIVSSLEQYFESFLAQRETLHGVFMEVMGIGVLLAGSSGVGKSELALELITRGHRLIADDAPEFSRAAPDVIRGSCPKPLQDFLEVRGLGILDIRAMFGDNAIKKGEDLQLIVRLTRMVEGDISKIDRLQGDTRIVKILGVDVPEINVPVLMGGHLAVVVEGAVRNHLLMQSGYNASEEFIARQKRIMAEGDA